MKLIFCPYCGDLFKLRFDMKSCECGKVYGRYVDNSQAEVNKDAISVAIGNGSLHNAIAKLNDLRGTFSRDSYIDMAKITHAWCRPNDGKGNPHTKIIKEET